MQPSLSRWGLPCISRHLRFSSASRSDRSQRYLPLAFWKGNPPQPQIAFDANNHPLTGQGLAYDAAGEITGDGTHSYLYDGENRIACVDPATPDTCANGGAVVYTYDAEGRRVRKQSGAGTVDYILDLSGQTVSEVNSSGGLNRSEVYVGGRHLATYSGNTAT